MDRKEFLAALAGLTAQALFTEGERPPESHAAVLRSVRATYLAVAAGLPLEAVAGDGFLLEVTHRGLFQLFQGRTLVPAHSTHLQFIFRASRITLPLGQMILLDAELAKETIEDALWSIGLRQAVAERRRTHLTRAMAQGRAPRRSADLQFLRALEAAIDRLAQTKVDLLAASLAADMILERRSPRPEPDSEVA
jgi:hypothetical protein